MKLITTSLLRSYHSRSHFQTLSNYIVGLLCAHPVVVRFYRWVFPLFTAAPVSSRFLSVLPFPAPSIFFCVPYLLWQFGARAAFLSVSIACPQSAHEL